MNSNKESYICDNFVLESYQDYSVNTIADLLLPTGLLVDRTTQYIGNMEKLVFLKGNFNEVYTLPEIKFINDITNIFIFKDYFKKTKKTIIPCRVLTAKIDSNDVISSSIAFTKIINKALDGMNICFFISREGFIFTGKLFERENSIGCFVSDLIRTREHYEELVSELMFCSLYDEFVEYYSYIKSVLHYNENVNFLSQIPYSYIENLWEIQKILDVDFSQEIEELFWKSENLVEFPYSEKVKECEECLFKIESSKINTMEILFEAEEIEKFSSQAEEKYNDMLKQGEKDSIEEIVIDKETKALLNDPEDIIKMLKKKRGI